MSMSPATWARTRPSSPGAQISRRTAWGERTARTGAPGGPASDPSQAWSRQGDSAAPRTVLRAAARRGATVACSAIVSASARSTRRHPDGRDRKRLRPSTYDRAAVPWKSSGAPARVLDVVLDQGDRGDPAHGEGAVLPAALVVPLQEATDQGHRA